MAIAVGRSLSEQSAEFDARITALEGRIAQLELVLSALTKPNDALQSTAAAPAPHSR
jgi:uncharacterized coiled-coil protein SlyX